MKTTLLSLCCLALCGQAQAQESFSPPPTGETLSNQTLIEQALLRALAGSNNGVGVQPAQVAPPIPVRPVVPPAAAPSAPTITPRTTLRPVPTLSSNSIVVPNVPATAAPTNAAAPRATIAPGDQIVARPSPRGTNGPPEETLAAGMISFPATDLNQVLEVYAQLVGRTVLRPTTLPAPTITLRTQTPLTRGEAIEA